MYQSYMYYYVQKLHVLLCTKATCIIMYQSYMYYYVPKLHVLLCTKATCIIMYKSYMYYYVQKLHVLLCTKATCIIMYQSYMYYYVPKLHVLLCTKATCIIMYKSYMYYYAHTDCSAHSLCNTSLTQVCPHAHRSSGEWGLLSWLGVRKGRFCSYQLFSHRVRPGQILLTVQSWYLENHLVLIYLSCDWQHWAKQK